MGDLSAHFSRTEMACRCGRTLAGCKGTLALPALISGLEALRRLGYPGGLVIRSGYRCPERNRAVGGAGQSQHVYGAAADVDLRVELAQVVALRRFSGIGWQEVGGRKLVRHVDVRHASGSNPTLGTVTRPTTWEYLADGTRR